MHTKPSAGNEPSDPRDEEAPYDVVIVGAGASGTALLYALAAYTDIGRIALVEKYAKPGQVNSRFTNNSQTLHVGDIETNYSVEKVREVYPAAMMVVRYAEKLPKEERDAFLFPTPKMVLAVGDREVATLERRFADLSPIFPRMRKLDRDEIAAVEPAVISGRSSDVPLLALHTTDGFAVDFQALSESFVRNARRMRPDADVLFSTKVERIERDPSDESAYVLRTADERNLRTRALVVDADSYTLLLAQQLGYGTEFSLIPIGGSFYFSRKILNGKVYTVQEPKLPFAAVHGDPDIHADGRTRWGPTARFHPVLEARNPGTAGDYLRSSGLERWKTWRSFLKILLDPVRFRYLVENMLYEIPVVGTLMFLRNVRKIVPSIRFSDVEKAVGYGGMRLQRVNVNTRELLLGEGKITGDRAIFNMTPSPGASVCLYNAMRDAETVARFLGPAVTFDRERMRRELYAGGTGDPCQDVSLRNTYAS